MNVDGLKKLAAEKAVEEISSGMIVGLGTGSTVQFALEKISERIKNNELKNIIGIPSSSKTEKEAIRLEIPITTLNELYLSEDEKHKKGNGNQKHVLSASEGSEIRNQKSESIIHHPSSIIHHSSSITHHPLPIFIDLTIDGADEFDEQLNLIKGGGGALLREKILAQASKRLIIITDGSKQSKYLGTKWPVPIEVFKFCFDLEKKFLESLNAKAEPRKNSDGSNYITDENNFILDADFGEIKNVKGLADILNDRAGIVEHGLFVGLADKIICAKESGIEIYTRNS